MASEGNSKSGLLTAGGILSIIAGALKVISGGIIVVVTANIGILLRLALLPFHRGDWFERIAPVIPTWFIVGVPLLALGIIAIIGGISAIRKESFGLSLAGAICAFIPFNLLGLLAIIFVSLSKKDFEAEK